MKNNNFDNESKNLNYNSLANFKRLNQYNDLIQKKVKKNSEQWMIKIIMLSFTV